MFKQNGSLLNVLAVIPWWLSLALAALIFAILSVLLPGLNLQGRIDQALVVAGQNIAPILSSVLILSGSVSAVHNRRRKKSNAEPSGGGLSSTEPSAELAGCFADIFRRQGYIVQEAPEDQPDGQILLTAERDGQLTLIQYRLGPAKVGLGTVRSLCRSMRSKGARRGLLLTQGDFSTAAWICAAVKRIDLIDGTSLPDMMHRGGSAGRSELQAVKDVRQFRCPQCGAAMDLKKAKRGSHAGLHFWGCSRFPSCNGILAYSLQES